MKKIICFIAFIMAMLVSVSAQNTWLGGTVSLYASNKTIPSSEYYGYGSTNNYSTIQMSVEVGHYFNEHIGIGFIAGMSSHSTFGGKNNEIGTYFRYRMLHKDNLSLNLDLLTKYYVDSYDEYSVGTARYFSIGIRPGIQYNFTKYFAVGFNLGEITYNGRINKYYTSDSYPDSILNWSFDMLNPALALYYTF